MMTCHTELRDSIVEAVKTNVEGKDVAVACSGGLDSGLVSALAKRYARSVTLYTCGTSNAFDVAMAKDLSEKIEKVLSARAAENLSDKKALRQLAKLKYANISTISSFCVGVVRQHFEALGLLRLQSVL